MRRAYTKLSRTQQIKRAEKQLRREDKERQERKEREYRNGSKLFITYYIISALILLAFMLLLNMLTYPPIMPISIP